MPASTRGNLSVPFLALGVLIAAAVVVGQFRYPDVLGYHRAQTLAFGWLLVAFALTYSYRPLRESRYGVLITALFVMLFALFHYLQGERGLLLPFGLFALALGTFWYQLRKLRTDDSGRGQVS